jgi:prepilin-type N-terminal cleavage/methylation domain-containing protein
MKKSAFSLIELMVVVAIVAFLASISVPRYFKYVAKAKQAEVQMMLSSIFTAQQSHWAEHNEYCAELSGANGIGWKPEGYSGGKDSNFYYTYGIYFSGAQEGVHYFTGKLGAKKELLSGTKADKEGFVIKAAADLRGKGKFDVWSIDETKKISHLQDGVD